MKALATQIYAAVQSGRLAQPFDAAMVKQACPGWADKTYHTFLSKHAVGNGTTTELFVRADRGFYRVRDAGDVLLRHEDIKDCHLAARRLAQRSPNISLEDLERDLEKRSSGRGCRLTYSDNSVRRRLRGGSK
jgi:hypothetical protein